MRGNTHTMRHYRREETQFRGVRGLPSMDSNKIDVQRKTYKIHSLVCWTFGHFFYVEGGVYFPEQITFY